MSYLMRNGTGRNNIVYGGGSGTKGKYLRRTSNGRNDISFIQVSSNGIHKLLERISTSLNSIRWNNLTFSFFTPYTGTYKSSTTITIPNGCNHIDIFCVGGGGKGSKGYNSSRTTYGGGGGGAGYTKTVSNLTVSAGQSISITVGAGSSTRSGITTKVYGCTSSAIRSGNTLCSATGGQSGMGMDGDGVPGGSGGGTGAYADLSDRYYSYPTAGGSNGANGVNNKEFNGGTGQGTTTRAFGESSGTLYAGGGGGGGSESPMLDAAAGGSGGGGRGGNGSSQMAPGSPGSANTGGGGGGGGSRVSSTAEEPDSGNGGSGIVLIRFKI